MVTNGDLRRDVQELLTEVAVLKSRLQTKEETLKHQAVEYERRLSELNHAHAEARAKENTFLGIAVFNPFKEELQIWRASVVTALAKDEGRRASYTAIVAFIVSLASFGIALLKYLM